MKKPITAQYIADQIQWVHKNAGDKPLTVERLAMLTYFCYVRHLAAYREPLFGDAIIATENGMTVDVQLTEQKEV